MSVLETKRGQGSNLIKPHLKGTSLEVGILATTLPPNLRTVPTGTRTICEIVQLFQYGFLDLFAHCMQSLT